VAIESTESLRLFFEETEFGVEVILDPDSFRTPVKGLFDNEFLQVDSGIGSYAMSEPMVMCATADVAAVSEGDALEIDGVSFTVKSIQPDGTGMTNLMLART
jgi:hypothetical protein